MCIVPHGPTRTAKGTFLDAIASTLGDYAVAAELDLLAERNRAGGPRPELVRLRGARMVSVGPNKSKTEAVGVPLENTLRQRPRDVSRPLRETDHLSDHSARSGSLPTTAQVSRVTTTRFGHACASCLFVAQIPEAERDPLVRAELREPSKHGSAILNWALEGLRLWQTEGLHPPSAVRVATQGYRTEMDPDSADFSQTAASCIQMSGRRANVSVRCTSGGPPRAETTRLTARDFVTDSDAMAQKQTDGMPAVVGAASDCWAISKERDA